jgi:hypothetical protein
MNREERGILVGMVMGDGCLRVRKRYESGRENQTVTLLQISHSIKQVDYLRYKAERVSNILGGRSKVTYYDVKLKGHSAAYKMARTIKVSKYFEQLRGWIYPTGKKEINSRVLDMLTPEGLTLWYLDDGHTKWSWNKEGNITAAQSLWAVCLPVPQISLLQEYLFDVYGFDSQMVMVNSSNMLNFKSKVSHEMREMFRSYTPDSMLYKICPTSARLPPRLRRDEDIV